MRRYKIISQLWQPFGDKNISIYAAGACFYLFLSAIPGTVLFLSLISRFTFTSQIVETLFRDAFPHSLLPVLSSFWEYIVNTHSVTIVSLSFFTLLWTASKGILSIMDGVNFALGYPRVKNYFYRQFLSIIYLLLFCLSILLLLVCLVFADALTACLPQPFQIVEKIFHYRGIIAFIILTISFTLLIRFLPTKHLPVKYCLLGAAITSAVWMILSLLFSLYIKYFSNYDRIYGGFGMVLLLQIWLKICISVFLYSCVFIKLKYEDQYHPLQVVKDFLSFHN